MSTKKPRPPPERHGVYPTRYITADGQIFATCCLWDGECWRWWQTMFDPAEWDPVHLNNCAVIDWIEPSAAFKEIT